MNDYRGRSAGRADVERVEIEPVRAGRYLPQRPNAVTLARRARDLDALPGKVWIEVEVAPQTRGGRSWAARLAAIGGLCLLWATGLGAATVWPRWNRAEMLQTELCQQQPLTAAVEQRVRDAQHALGAAALSGKGNRVLSANEAPRFLKEIRAHAAGLGAKLIVLEHTESGTSPMSLRARLVAEGSFPALYSLLHYLESRPVFVAVNRAEIAPVETGGRLKACYYFEFLVVPTATAAVDPGVHA